MNINNSTINFQGKAPIRKLVPASQMQGLRLQLTEAEAAKINDLQKNVVQMEEDLAARLKKIARKKYTPAYKQQIKDEVNKQKNQIDALKETIRNIKINRFAEQKKSCRIKR